MSIKHIPALDPKTAAELEEQLKRSMEEEGSRLPPIMTDEDKQRYLVLMRKQQLRTCSLPWLVNTSRRRGCACYVAPYDAVRHAACCRLSVGGAAPWHPPGQPGTESRRER
jgi:hypothetical protein